MTTPFVVTIARQFGSLGRPIARTVSEAIGVEYYDRDIVELAAQRLGLPVSTISTVEESARSTLFGMSEPLGAGTTLIQDEIFNAQRRIILDLADRAPCIIVGRCADHVLGERPDVMKVFIYAPYAARLRNCVEQLHLDVAEAKHLISAVDKARESYQRHYCGYSMSNKEHKHLMLDSSLLGVEGTCAALEFIIRARFGLG
ncbi:AAA family ATPase [Propionicimonas sp.]|uniref:cytidylate kinase-like family protein n=1 Tax=Propionicimonas sp. TaxID=1955623 RepID=UPI0039E614C5